MSLFSSISRQKRRAATMAASVASFGAVAYSLTDAASPFHEFILMPLVHKTLDAETAHKTAILLAEYGLVPRDRTPHDPRAQVNIFGRTLPSPVGLAAGFDKDARAVPALFSLGFAAVEVGSVTPLPQPGNPTPRLFRSRIDGAVINRYGFNSQGHAAVRARLEPKGETAKERYGETRMECENLVGVNLGVNKELVDPAASYAAGVKAFGDRADYIVVNVSSPNTAGLRALQAGDSLRLVLKTAVEAANGKVPVVAKISPDLSDEELKDVANAVLESGASGVIVTNTTLSRPESLVDKEFAAEVGGLSGKPLFPISLAAVRQMYRLVGHKIPVIGSGGVSTADDAIAMARAGASFIQLYSSLSLRGPGVVPEIKSGISKYLEKENCSWMDLVGKDNFTKRV